MNAVNARRTYYQCPNCGKMHKADGAYPVSWSRAHLDRAYSPRGWNEIRADEVAAWRAGVAANGETTSMTDFNPVPIYSCGSRSYTAVYFEELGRWYIRCDDADAQTWSVTGYDTPREAKQAFDGLVTHTNKPPGET